jgi:hypothetical protein
LSSLGGIFPPHTQKAFRTSLGERETQGNMINASRMTIELLLRTCSDTK